MFGFARTIFRHKILMLALLLAGYFLFAGNKEVPKPTSAWAHNAPSPSAFGVAKEKTWTEKGLTLLNDGAKYIGVEEYMPAALQEKAVDGFKKTGGMLDSVNSGKNQD
jgi:hypothetical protein